MNKKSSILFLLAFFCLSGFAQLNWSPTFYCAIPSTTTNDDGIWFDDFNNDGKTDMIARHYFQNTLTLFLNNGNGSFITTSSIASNAFLNDLVLADLNNDNNLDIAVTNANYYGNPDVVTIHLGNGNGTFQPMQSYSSFGSYKYTLDAGDVTGDGYKDLVVSSAGWDGFSILVNNGNGTFRPGNSYASTNECISIKLADFNRDNHLDVALGNGSGVLNNQIDVFFGNGDGTFNPRFNSYPTANHPFLIMCDVDNQNGTDIVFDILDNHTSYYLKNNGSGFFTQVLIKENYDVTCVCDWNNDNYMDFVAVGWDPINHIKTGTYLILNEGFDFFAEPLLLDPSYSGSVGKLNTDSHYDFAYVNTAIQAVGVKLQIVTPQTGIMQTTNENMQVYTNSSNDLLTIYTGMSYENGLNCSIKILNTLGYTVFESTIKSPFISLEATKLGVNGIFFIQLIDQNGKIREVCKFILK